MRHHKPCTTILTAALVFLAMGIIFLYLRSPLAYATSATLYVSATGECGSSNPCYSTIQAAVNAAQSGDSIKVAQGVYTSTGFQVVYIDKALSITGGYTTTNWTDSYSMTNPTVIDAENAIRRRAMYVDGSGTGGMITLKALVIQRGNASIGDGGGIYIHGGNVLLQDSQVLTNTAPGGGGMLVNDGNVTVESVIYRGNSSDGASGMLVRQGFVSINNSVFIDNKNYSYGAGGGIRNIQGSVVVNASTIQGSTGPYHGGGIFQEGGTITVTNSVIKSNSAYMGGGISISGGKALIRDSQVLSNTSYFGSAGIEVTGDAEVDNNLIAGNFANEACAGIFSGAATLRRNTIIRNTARWDGGGVCMDGGLLEGNLIFGNSANEAGGVRLGRDTYTTEGSLRDNRIISNTASTTGGAIHISSGVFTATNDILARNASLYEGVYISGGDLTARHWTMVGNGKYGVDVVGGTVAIINSIAVSHTLGAFYGSGISADHNLFYANGATCSAGATCTNNLTGDPKFVDPANDDYHIQAGSAAIDAGINLGVTSDNDGELRPYLGYDLGSDEYWPLGATLMMLTSSTNPSLVGQSVGFVATVISPAGTPPGSVTFKDGSTVLCAAVPLVGGKATCTHSYATPGGHTITAEYSGDGTLTPNTETLAGGQTVSKANTTTTLTGHSPHPSKPGEAVTVHYSVAVNAPGSGTPNGNVTVSDGVDSCTGSAAAGSCIVTLKTVGTRTLTANYAGNSNLNGSTSTGVLHTVNLPMSEMYLPLLLR